MPRYCFSLAVRVGCKVDGFCVFAELLELVNDLLVILHRDILRLKIVFYINSEGALGQIAQVSHALARLLPDISLDLQQRKLGKHFCRCKSAALNDRVNMNRSFIHCSDYLQLTRA